MNHIKKSSYFHFGNNHPEVLTYYQIAAVIPKMAYVRTLQIFFVSVGQMLYLMILTIYPKLFSNINATLLTYFKILM